MVMGTQYRHLSQSERGQIMFMSRWGKSITEIAGELGWHKSTIARELRRNADHLLGYYWDYNAQHQATGRRHQASRRYRLKSEHIRAYVERQLEAGWSPELIAGRIGLDLPGCRISHEAIYQYVYHLDEPERSKYIGCLCRSHRHRHHRRTGKSQHKSRIPNRISIADRPATAATRRQFGHWEGDSMVSSRNSTVLYTLVERKTRLVRFTRVRGRDGARTAAAITKRLRPLPARARRTLTIDNGIEHVRHERITEAIGIGCYFCDPYSAWQRGTNENRNGIVRRYFPKGTDFAKLTQAEIERVESAINNRPMKCLGFKTPNEAASRFVALRC